MSKLNPETARRISDSVFSSMSFGGLFCTWILVTGLVATKKGWIVVVYSAAAYATLWISVAVLGWLLEAASSK